MFYVFVVASLIFVVVLATIRPADPKTQRLGQKTTSLDSKSSILVDCAVTSAVVAPDDTLGPGAHLVGLHLTHLDHHPGLLQGWGGMEEQG